MRVPPCYFYIFVLLCIMYKNGKIGEQYGCKSKRQTHNEKTSSVWM